jgi:hypothetical protein
VRSDSGGAKTPWLIPQCPILSALPSIRSGLRITRVGTVLVAAREPCSAEALDLSRAVVVSPPNLSAPEKKAVEMLVEEVEKRTPVRHEGELNLAWYGESGGGGSGRGCRVAEVWRIKK